MKDREGKVHQAKISKTARRNSKESMFNDAIKSKPNEMGSKTIPIENTFDFI